jgi:organic hydroperoxide reductase OsmC/OhrA
MDGESTMTHEYHARIDWTGNAGTGTDTYASYRREYRIDIHGKPPLTGSADPKFRGDGALHNPEDLFVAAVAACHMLTYLALCARRGVQVVGYRDAAVGSLALEPAGGGRFERVVLRPDVTIADGADGDLAAALHAEAHDQCVIAQSCRVPIACEPTVRVAESGARRSA